MSASRGCILTGSFVGAFLALICLAAILTTTKPKIPACPQCGLANPKATVLAEDATSYECSCGHVYVGPSRSDFSWAGAVQNWLDEESN